MKFAFALVLALSFSNAFARDIVVRDVESCAQPEMKYELGRMLDYVEDGYLILPISNAKQEMVGFIPVSPPSDGDKEFRFNGIQLCGRFMGSFYYNDDDAELARNWVTDRARKMSINQDEGTLKLVVKNAKSDPKDESQLVRAQFEAFDYTIAEKETLVGKGEFFVRIPKAWLK